MQDLVGCGIDDIDRIAVFVDDVHTCVVGAGPDTVGFYVAHTYCGDEDWVGAGGVLAIDICAVESGNCNPAVGYVIDDGEVRVVGFSAGFKDCDDFLLL